MPQRKGQVKPEFQPWFPSVRAAHWYPAAELARRVRAQLRSGEPRWEAGGRIRSDHHFGFRGGHDERPLTSCTRTTDLEGPTA